MPTCPASIYDVECTDLFGKPLPLRSFAGKPMMIVNTASLCGFSSQFKGIEALYQANRDKGLVVIGVPVNDFGSQEPGDNPKIATLCTTKFGVSFPFLGKTTTKGEQAHPIFNWIAKEGGFMAKPRWNFYKYLIDREGRLRNWFTPLTPPEATRMHEAVAKII